MLAERLWRLLDGLADGPQPLEKMYADYAGFVLEATPADLLADLAELEAGGLIACTPPLPPEAGQAVPAGIRVSATPQGEAEWDAASYAAYWKTPAQPEAQPEKNFAFPPRAKYAITALCLGLMALAIWGYAQSTYSMSADVPVDLSRCLAPVRSALVEAGASAEVLLQLDRASQPGNWKTDSLSRLVVVNQALDNLSPEVRAALRPGLETLIKACRPDGENCGCGP